MTIVRTYVSNLTRGCLIHILNEEIGRNWSLDSHSQIFNLRPFIPNPPMSILHRDPFHDCTGGSKYIPGDTQGWVGFKGVEDGVRPMHWT